MKKIVTFGEVLLRLTTPGNLRFSQSRDYVATFGGSETNVAVSLANFGIPTEFVTRLPDNDIARACISDLRSHGLRTDGIIYGGDRMGIYFLENGASFRNSKVVYDRSVSSHQLPYAHISTDSSGSSSHRRSLVPSGLPSEELPGKYRLRPVTKRRLLPTNETIHQSPISHRQLFRQLM